MKAKFKKKFIYIIIAFAVFALSLHIFTSRYTIAIAHEECLPERVWLIEKSKIPSERGDYITFLCRNIPRYKDSTKMTKIIVGIPGDTVIVKPASGENEIMLNGMKRTMKIKAEVSVVSNGTTRRFIAYENGSDGRPLPFFHKYGSLVIPEGHFFVAGKHPGSYDSRYWGLIKTDNVIGKAHPIL